jgi:hypothetical protein
MPVDPDSRRRAVDVSRVSAAAYDRNLADVGGARVRALRMQFTIAVAVTIGLVLVSALALSLLMTISSTAAFMVVGPLGVGALLLVARLLVTPIVGDVEALRDPPAAARLGDDGVRAREAGGLADSEASRIPGRPRRSESADFVRQDALTAVARDMRGSVTSLRLLAGAVDGETGWQMRVHLDSLAHLAEALGEPARPHTADVNRSPQAAEPVGVAPGAASAARAAGGGQVRLDQGAVFAGLDRHRCAGEVGPLAHAGESEA